MSKIEDLAKKLIDKNPSLVRDIMESDFIIIKRLEVRQGKVIKCEIEQKNYQRSGE